MAKNITVFCASSTMAPDFYKRQAYALGEILADNSLHCFYGGGRVGLMGELSRAMVAKHGTITGIIPRFMVDEGWDNPSVEEIVVPDMSVRKQMLIEKADAIVALPGGCGTLEELMVAITSRQLGLVSCPIVIVNLDGFFDPLLAMMDNAVKQNLMRRRHLDLWSVVPDVSSVLEAIKNAPVLNDARGIAAM